MRPLQVTVAGLTIEVSVCNQPVLQGEQAGLIWYVDDANYIKLVKESPDNRIWIVLAREEHDEPALVDEVPVVADTARLPPSLTEGMGAGECLIPESER